MVPKVAGEYKTQRGAVSYKFEDEEQEDGMAEVVRAAPARPATRVPLTAFVPSAMRPRARSLASPPTSAPCPCSPPASTSARRAPSWCVARPRSAHGAGASPPLTRCDIPQREWTTFFALASGPMFAPLFFYNVAKNNAAKPKTA